MSDDEYWPPEKPVVIQAEAHPAHSDAPFHTGKLTKLLSVGDKVAIPERYYPLTVAERLTSREGERDQGHRLVAWKLEGTQGGEYKLSNWLHWGPDTEKYEDHDRDDPQGLYPQIRNLDGNDLLGHVKQMAIVEGGGWVQPEHVERKAEEHGDVWDRIAYQKPKHDFPRLGEVLTWEYGDPVVQERIPYHWEDVQLRYDDVIYNLGPEESVALEHVDAYALGGDQ